MSTSPVEPTRRALASVAVVLLTAPASTLAQERVVHVQEEPRHRLLVAEESMYVLDVQIQPGDTTLYHTHSTPITYVTVGTSSTDQQVIGTEWNGSQPRTPPPGRVGAVRSVTSYADSPLTHRVTNIGTTLFRLIAIASRTEGAHAGDPSAATALPGSEELVSAWFRASTVSLDRGGSTTIEPVAPIVVVLVTEGRAAAVHDDDGWVTSLERPGATTVLHPGSTYTLRSGLDGADVVLVEVR